MNKRDFLKLLATSSPALLFPQWAQAVTKVANKTSVSEKTLIFYNTHTGEKCKETYWVKGRYQSGALKKFDHLMRDHRTKEIKAIDKNLFDRLFAIQQMTGKHSEIHVVSGYRSPATNKKLKGTAVNSMHMVGRAVDIQMPGTRLVHIKNAAIKIASAHKCGGVGSYRSFVHIDTGRKRCW